MITTTDVVRKLGEKLDDGDVAENGEARWPTADRTERARDFVRSNPTGCLIAAFGVGFALCLLARRI